MSTTDQQTLPQPFDLPAPERVVVDISIEPWEDGKSTTGDPGRFPMSVPRAVADHVMRVKHIAAQTSASDFTHVLGALQKETAPARADLAHMDSDYEAAKQAGATEVQLQAITGLQLAARQQTRAQLEAAVNRVIGPVRETLATAAGDARARGSAWDAAHGCRLRGSVGSGENAGSRARARRGPVVDGAAGAQPGDVGENRAHRGDATAAEGPPGQPVVADARSG